MRDFSFVAAVAASLAVLVSANALALPAGIAIGLHPSPNSGTAGPIVLAKIKCGINSNGDFVCRNNKGRRSRPQQDNKPENKPEPKPSKAGQCMTTETTNSGALDCGSLARSCGPVQNGKMTCCCRN